MARDATDTRSACSRPRRPSSPTTASTRCRSSASSSGPGSGTRRRCTTTSAVATACCTRSSSVTTAASRTSATEMLTRLEAEGRTRRPPRAGRGAGRAVQPELDTASGREYLQIVSQLSMLFDLWDVDLAGRSDRDPAYVPVDRRLPAAPRTAAASRAHHHVPRSGHRGAGDAGPGARCARVASAGPRPRRVRRQPRRHGRRRAVGTDHHRAPTDPRIPVPDVPPYVPAPRPARRQDACSSPPRPAPASASPSRNGASKRARVS